MLFGSVVVVSSVLLFEAFFQLLVFSCVGWWHLRNILHLFCYLFSFHFYMFVVPILLLSCPDTVWFTS